VRPLWTPRPGYDKRPDTTLAIAAEPVVRAQRRYAWSAQGTGGAPEEPADRGQIIMEFRWSPATFPLSPMPTVLRRWA